MSMKGPPLEGKIYRIIYIVTNYFFRQFRKEARAPQTYLAGHMRPAGNSVFKTPEVESLLAGKKESGNKTSRIEHDISNKGQNILLMILSIVVHYYAVIVEHVQRVRTLLKGF